MFRVFKNYCQIISQRKLYKVNSLNLPVSNGFYLQPNQESNNKAAHDLRGQEGKLPQDQAGKDSQVSEEFRTLTV